MTLNTVLWSILGTTLATIISRVTYGLRRQVAEANELGQYVLEEKIGGGGMGEVPSDAGPENRAASAGKADPERATLGLHISRPRVMIRNTNVA